MRTYEYRKSSDGERYGSLTRVSGAFSRGYYNVELTRVTRRTTSTIQRQVETLTAARKLIRDWVVQGLR